EALDPAEPDEEAGGAADLGAAEHQLVDAGVELLREVGPGLAEVVGLAGVRLQVVEGGNRVPEAGPQPLPLAGADGHRIPLVPEHDLPAALDAGTGEPADLAREQPAHVHPVVLAVGRTRPS